jgi:hypothetical protein
MDAKKPYLTSLSLVASPEYRNDTRILPTLAYHVRFEYIQDISGTKRVTVMAHVKAQTPMKITLPNIL